MLKERLLPVDGDGVLRKISRISLTGWNYKFESTSRHFGPMAHQFFGAFGRDSVGQIRRSDTISSGDEAGILMIAVQALEKERELLKTKVGTMQVEDSELKTRLDKMEALLNKLACIVTTTNGDQLTENQRVTDLRL